ncbi:MAG: methyltransferase domain-containing protein [Candidatus Omnitrophica bacterium]|nr:methyltransferase domain-containing protein [Candidatus Omnitrophota bacterium]MDD5546027.1 methyltransferase domain-containing protein [Candidatus Omnitrophota bacterium]
MPSFREIVDFMTFPLRAVTLFEEDKWGLSSLASERFSYARKEVLGYCLDVGCGRHNKFIAEYLKGNGKGIDVYRYEGLSEENVIKDTSHFPFDDRSFDSATFIANLNHIPRPLRDVELREAYRCLKDRGNIIVTMGDPLAEILVHKVVMLYDKIFGTHHDVDSERGMSGDEEYYLTAAEITGRLKAAGFVNIKKKYFWTQWYLNALYVAWKK